MFISSKVRFLVHRADGSKYVIPEGFVGEIPDDVGRSAIVQLAIRGGEIVTPQSHKDADVEKPKRKTAKK